jgi:hypothetical protein
VATGYEVKAYHDLASLARSAKVIEISLGQLAIAAESVAESLALVVALLNEPEVE